MRTSDDRSRQALARDDYIDNRSLREHYLEKRLFRGEGYENSICEILGWDRREVHRIRQYLGLAPYNSKGKKMTRRRVSRDTARILGNAMDLDPVDYGL
jgi:hypothetical protein